MFGAIISGAAAVAGAFLNKSSGSSGSSSSRTPAAATTTGAVTAEQVQAWYAQLNAQNAAVTAQMFEEYTDLAERNQLVSLAAVPPAAGLSPAIVAVVGLLGLAVIFALKD